MLETYFAGSRSIHLRKSSMILRIHRPFSDSDLSCHSAIISFRTNCHRQAGFPGEIPFIVKTLSISFRFPFLFYLFYFSVHLPTLGLHVVESNFDQKIRSQEIWGHMRANVHRIIAVCTGHCAMGDYALRPGTSSRIAEAAEREKPSVTSLLEPGCGH